MVYFVLTLRKGWYKNQFKLLAFSMATLFFTMGQIFFLHKLSVRGNVWSVFPIAMNVVSDVMAYVSGRLFGRTKLTNLSPNKTLEGYIGGVLSSALLSFAVRTFSLAIWGNTLF